MDITIICAGTVASADLMTPKSVYLTAIDLYTGNLLAQVRCYIHQMLNCLHDADSSHYLAT